MFNFFLYFLVVLVGSSEGVRILAVYSMPSLSHHSVFRPITIELLKRGHEVTVITPDVIYPKGQAHPNITEINLHDISYATWRNITKEFAKEKSDFITQITILIYLVTNIFFKQMENKEVLNMLNNPSKQFDLILLEAAVKSALIFSHFYKVPVIQVSSLGGVLDNYDTIGAPVHPILYPSVIRRRIHNLSAWEKITEMYDYYKLCNVLYENEKATDAMIKRQFGENIPNIRDLMNNVDMLFLNMHPLMEGIRPVPPGVIYLGGLHQKPQKELPADLKAYLDSAKHGVIYISFGTNVFPSLLPPERIQTIIKVFSDLPYNVLWKYDKDELPGKTDNIKIGKWFPQADLLRHPNIKVFITQAGLQSTDEAITAGVPLIGFPIFGDQWFNAEKYEHHKIGFKLDIETLSYDGFKNAIVTLINDDSYRRNIVRLRELMHDEPMKPLDRAMWWIEYVIRHGGAKHLRSPAANITWTQYLELEIVLTLLAGLVVCLALLATILYFLCKSILKLLAKPKDRSDKKKL